MKISAKTKISALIKENKAAIDVIASINSHFNKLKNPVLRRVLAPRVTIADASKIGGVSVDVFLNKLAEAGFEIGDSKKINIQKEVSKKQLIKKDMIKSFDVRPIIEGGQDPFKEIMEKIKDIQQNETLEIINSFEPIPLINILKSKGFECETEHKEGAVYTYFKKLEESKDELISEENGETDTEFDITYKKYIGKMEHVDVRHLEMPEPMTTVLSKLEQLPEDNCLLVDHKKVPQFLLPELENRNYNILYNRKTEDHIQLLIFKK